MQRKVTDYASKAHETTLTGFLLDIIPDTFLSALTAGHILQTLLVSILFGIALALVGDKGDQDARRCSNQLSLVVFRLVAIIMAAAPIGAFGAMAFTIGKYGIGSLANLADAGRDFLSHRRCCSCWSCWERWRGWPASRSSG